MIEFPMTSPLEQINNVERISRVSGEDEAYQLLEKEFAGKKVGMRCTYCAAGDVPLDLSYTIKAGSGFFADDDDEEVTLIIKPADQIAESGTEFDVAPNEPVETRATTLNFGPDGDDTWNQFTGNTAVGFQKDPELMVLTAEEENAKTIEATPRSVTKNDIKKAIIIYDLDKLSTGLNRGAGGYGEGNMVIASPDRSDAVLKVIVLDK